MPPGRPPDFLAECARAHPEKLAVVEDRAGHAPTRWSFAELDQRVNRLANALRELGAAPGDRVLWCGRNSPGVIQAIHAARKLGVTAVPLNYRLVAEEAAYVADHSDAAFCVVDAEYAGLLAELRPRAPRLRHVLVFDGAPAPGQESLEALCGEASPEEPPPPPADHFAAVMTYTSGTTGRPKGALREAPGNPAQGQALLDAFGAAPGDVYITTGPLYHSGPGGWVAICHRLGNTVVVLRHFDPEEWLRLVEKYRVTCTTCAPTPMRRICHLPAAVRDRYDTGSLRYVIGSAAAWSDELKRDYVRTFGEGSLYEVYGSTELGATTLLGPDDVLRKPGSCGRPAPGVEIQLVDDAGGEVREAGVPGELYARSAASFSAYHKNAEAFDDSSRGEFRSVGDIAYRDEDGFYFICDRKVDMIVSGGVNVYPAEVEAALERHPDVVEVAVFGIPSAEWGEAVHAAVVAQPGRSLSRDDLTAFARKHLAGFKVPRSVEFVDALPRNELGKILKRSLREKFR